MYKIKIKNSTNNISLVEKSHEYQSSLAGNYSNFYSNIYWTQLKNNCLNTCLTNEGMGTKNLLMNEKVCARNCLVHAFAMRRYIDIFTEKQRSDKMMGYDQTLLNKM